LSRIGADTQHARGQSGFDQFGKHASSPEFARPQQAQN
jgi:hypothetical protein